MSGREPTTILKPIIEGQGRGAKLRSKLVANKEQNWLLALTLNSFAKLAANTPLSDLEQIIVRTFREKGFNDNDFKQHARLYQQIPDKMRSEIFPEKFARLNPETKYEYGINELKADLPSIERAILAKPNVRNMDVQAIHAKTASVRDYPKISQDVLKQYGSATLRAVAPDAPTPTALSQQRYTIKAVSFLCEEETSEWSSSDEPYWVFGTLGSSKISIATTSKVFNDTDAGETKTFDGADGNIWGENGLPQDFPNGEIGCVIQLWEHDEGDVSKAKAGVEAALNLAKTIVTAVGASALITAVITAAGPVIAWLLSFFDDDLISTQNFIFTRQVIEDQLGKTGKSLDVKRRFTDGDSSYVLTIRVSRVP
jgi:hypothetical protein